MLHHDEVLHHVRKKNLQGKEALDLLAQSGMFIFHGSHWSLGALEPQQAITVDRETSQLMAHGVPAVCASADAEVAIFRALINRHTAYDQRDYRSGFSWEEVGAIRFRASQSAITSARATSTVGYVHVLLREGFEEFDRLEHRNIERVMPLLVIRVTGRDLPPIEVI